MLTPSFVLQQDLRRDPSYFEYYTQNRISNRLNPRLPRPIPDFGYPSFARGYAQGPGGLEGEETLPEMDATGLGPFDSKPQSLNDRIQADFPRTPSRALHGEPSPDKQTTSSEELERNLLGLSLRASVSCCLFIRYRSSTHSMCLALQQAPASGIPGTTATVGMDHTTTGFFPPAPPPGQRSNPLPQEPKRVPLPQTDFRPTDYRHSEYRAAEYRPAEYRTEGYDPQPQVQAQHPGPQYEEMMQYSRGLEGFNGGLYAPAGAQVLPTGFPGAVGVPMAAMPPYYSPAGYQGLGARMHPEPMHAMSGPGGVPAFTPQHLAMAPEYGGTLHMHAPAAFSHAWDPSRAQQPQRQTGGWDKGRKGKKDRRSGNRGGSQQAPQSPAIAQFRLAIDRGEKPPLTSLAGHLGELARDQHGSRYIQQALEVCAPGYY